MTAAPMPSLTPSDASAPAGWQELATDDGLRVVGAPDCTWFVLGSQNRVMASYPGNVSIWVALALYRAGKESDELSNEQKEATPCIYCGGPREDPQFDNCSSCHDREVRYLERIADGNS